MTDGAVMTETWPWAREFAPETTYLNTASMGLPPRATIAALHDALGQWAAGRAQAGDFDAVVAEARTVFAGLVGVDPASVAIGHQVSTLVALVAASLPPGAHVLAPGGEFTSVTFPFAAHGIRVSEVPLAELAERIDGSVDVVALSAVQSADGAVADLEAIAAAADASGAEVLLDLTQAAGWLDVDASRFAWTVTGGYKWLLAPRGTAFLTVRPDLVQRTPPLAAGWYAGADRWDSIYGLPLRLADSARRLDASPAWHSWVGTLASLRLLTGIGVPALHAHAVGLEAVFARAAGLEPSGSAIRALDADAEVPRLLDQHAIVAAERAGRLRVSFHVNNTREEAERVGALLRGHVR